MLYIVFGKDCAVIVGPCDLINVVHLAELGCVCSVGCSRDYLLIPAVEHIGSVCQSGPCGSFAGVLGNGTVLDLIHGQNCAVIVLPGDLVNIEYLAEGRCVCNIVGNDGDLFIPAAELIGSRVCGRLGGSGAAVDRHQAVIYNFLSKDGAVIIRPCNCIFAGELTEHGCVGHIACDSYNFLIPALELVGDSLGIGLDGCGACIGGNCAVCYGILGEQSAVIVEPGDLIALEVLAEGRCIDHVSGNTCDLLIPAGKLIGSSVCRGFGGCSACISGNNAVSEYIFLQGITVIVEP